MQREEYAISEFSRAIVVEPHFVIEDFWNSKIAYYTRIWRLTFFLY